MQFGHQAVEDSQSCMRKPGHMVAGFFPRRLALPAFAARFTRFVAVIGEVARIIVLSLAVAALAGDLSLLLFIHDGESASALALFVFVVVHRGVVSE